MKKISDIFTVKILGTYLKKVLDSNPEIGNPN